jgi:hypothetical protein
LVLSPSLISHTKTYYGEKEKQSKEVNFDPNPNLGFLVKVNPLYVMKMCGVDEL